MDVNVTSTAVADCVHAVALMHVMVPATLVRTYHTSCQWAPIARGRLRLHSPVLLRRSISPLPLITAILPASVLPHTPRSPLPHRHAPVAVVRVIQTAMRGRSASRRHAHLIGMLRRWRHAIGPRPVLPAVGVCLLVLPRLVLLRHSAGRGPQLPARERVRLLVLRGAGEHGAGRRRRRVQGARAPAHRLAARAREHAPHPHRCHDSQCCPCHGKVGGRAGRRHARVGNMRRRPRHTGRHSVHAVAHAGRPRRHHAHAHGAW